MASETKLVEMLCTRLCHDITGPVGAISNGVEFLAEEGFEMQGPAIELVSQSASQAVSRLKYYRTAYGRVSQSGESDLLQIRDMIEAFFAGSKIKLDWPSGHTDPAHVTLGWKQTKLLLNLVIISSSTLIRGGEVAIRLAHEMDCHSLSVTAGGPQIKWDEGFGVALTESITDDALTPTLAQPAYTRLLAKELAWDITIEKTPEYFTMRAQGKRE